MKSLKNVTNIVTHYHLNFYKRQTFLTYDRREERVKEQLQNSWFNIQWTLTARPALKHTNTFRRLFLSRNVNKFS